MRIPGVKYVGYCDASAVSEEFELQAMAGITPVISGITFTPIHLRGEATLELSDSNENNGSNQKASLSFVTVSEFKEKRCAFLVACVSGAKYLIGSKASIPAITIKDNWTAPGTPNQTAVAVELSSPCAWIEIIGQVALSDNMPPVEWETWREITEQEIDEIINGLT